MTTAAKRKEERLQRLDPKAWIGYLVGYTSSNIYRIWVPLLNKVIFTRDVIFNEDEVFDGNLDHLHNAVREVTLEDLAQRLQRICASEQEHLEPQEESQTDPTAGQEDSGAFEVEDTPEEEEPEREEAPDLDKEAYTTARFEPFLTPPDTPPAALLAGAIQSPATRAPAAQPRVPSADQRVVDEKEHHVWQVAFNTGRLGNTIL